MTSEELIDEIIENKIFNDLTKAKFEILSSSIPEYKAVVKLKDNMRTIVASDWAKSRKAALIQLHQQLCVVYGHFPKALP